MNDHTRENQFKMTRRQLIKSSLIAGAGLMLPLDTVIGRLYAAESPALIPFLDPLPIPRAFAPRSTVGTTKYFDVSMREFKQQLHADMPPTSVWGYGDQDGASFPGPTFEARTGDNIVVNWINQLSNDPAARHYLRIDPAALHPNIHGAEDRRKVVVHLHGGHIPAAVDGFPEDTILPGQNVIYDYPIRQQAASLWYHDHSLGLTRLNVYMGLAGLFVVRDDNELGLLASNNLPQPGYEIPLVLQDRVFKSNGRLSYDARFDDMFLGDVLVVNGKVWPYLNVERRKYRFRVLNGSNTRVYTLQLPGNVPFYQIGTDGGLLAAPVMLTSLTLTPGERADIVIDFSQFAGGDDIVMENTAAPMPDMPEEEPEKQISKVIQFRVQYGSVSGDIELPAILVPGGIAAIPQDDALYREFKLEDYPDPNLGSKWLINGLGFEDITEFIEPGAVEIWRFINKSMMHHPMHLHLVQFQVLSRTKTVEGQTTIVGVDPNERGWKDTVRVMGKETVTVIAKFPDAPELFGHFPYHCHVLEHEDYDMMRQFVLG